MPPTDPQRVSIAQLPNGAWSISIGGRDVADLIQGFQFTGEPNKAEVMIRLVGINPELFAGKAKVVLSHNQTVLLESLGWTRPETSDPSETVPTTRTEEI